MQMNQIIYRQFLHVEFQIIRHIHNNIILFIDDLKSFRWRKIQSCLKEAKIEIWIVHIYTWHSIRRSKIPHLNRIVAAERYSITFYF